MKKIFALIIMMAFALSLFAACKPVDPEVLEILQPEARAATDMDLVVEEAPVVTATALFDGIPVLSHTAMRGDIVSITGEDGEYYTIDNNGTTMLIEKSMVRSGSEDMSEPVQHILKASANLFDTAYLTGEPAEIPEGTVINVEDAFNGVLYVRYTDGSGNEKTGYMSEAEAQFAEPETESAGSDSKNKSSGSSKKKTESNKSNQGNSESRQPAPAKEQEVNIPPDSVSENSGDGGEIALAAKDNIDYGFVLLAAEPNVVLQTNEGIEAPAGLAGDDQSDNPAGDVSESQTVYPMEGSVLSDGTEVYIGKLIKDTDYIVESSDDEKVLLYYDGINTGSVPRWSVFMEGDIPYETRQVYLSEDISVNTNCFGRGYNITALKDAMFTVAGETGDFYILMSEGGEVFYMGMDGADEYFISPEEWTEMQSETETESKQSDNKKTEKKSEKKKSGSSSSGEKSNPTPVTPAPAAEPKTTPETQTDPGNDDSQFTPVMK